MAALDLIGSSVKFRALLDQINMVARVDSAVLVQGETGTGKELIAQAIHEASPRRQNRFVAVNCAAIPSALLESELFGHERGAFTGAVTQTMGRFQQADHGTLFLDEIGDLPLELQPKLLRALQEQEFERLGCGRTIRVNVRVVAATNQDLAQMVSARQFRADLYYRLNVIPIFLPPLRERPDDIPALVEHFVRKYTARLNKPIHTIPDEVMECLKFHDWPGNIRELQNFIERAVVLSPGPVLRPTLTELRHMTKQPTAAAAQTLADASRDHILEDLEQSQGRIGGREGAAERRGLPRAPWG
jgi:transcriptional regulator with GAF, ATPase, and Fis domain